MKKIYLILVVISLAFNLKANKTDSLYNLIKNYKNYDSTYVNLIKDYCMEKSKGDYSDIDLLLINEGLELAKKLNLVMEQAYMYNFSGWHYYNISNFQDALLQFQNSIDVLENHKSSYLYFEVLSNITNTYNATKDFEKALEINLKLIAIVKPDSSSSNKARVYFYTAKTYDRLMDYDNADFYYLEAKRISQEANFEFGVVISNSSLAHNYNELKQYEKALPLIKSTIDFYEKADQKINIAACYSTMGNSYKGLGDFKNAISSYEKTIEISHEINNISNLKYNYSRLAESYWAIGNATKAIENYDNALFYADSLFNQERVQAIEEVKTQYETEKYKQEKIIANANELIADGKAKRSRFVSFGAVLFAILIAAFLYFISTKLNLIRKQKKELDSAYEQLEESKKNELAVSNLKALQSQMNPHFIFNALNSVQDLVLLKDIRSSNKFLGKFSDLIRKILLSSKNQFISLDEELEILSLYLDLEKLRFGEELHIDFSCDISEKKQVEIQLPAMFIQPYVENAIKHGLFSKKGQKRLKIAFKMIDENTLECIVEDNGIGQKQAAILKEKRLHLHTGFSTEAINERIRLLNQTLDKKIDLEIIDLEEDGKAIGTKVILLFPIKL